MEKRNYIKPDIGFESFCLSVDISAGCSLISNSAPMMCAIDVGYGTLIASGICSIIAGNEGEFCYDVPVADSNVFGS